MMTRMITTSHAKKNTIPGIVRPAIALVLAMSGQLPH
jgi:hypothetical protein